MLDIGTTIKEKLKAGKISLPSLPDNAIKLRSVAANPNSSLKDLALLIGHDAGVSAQLIRLAQTMRYSHPGCTITSLPMAINRIGMNGTVNLVLAMSILQGYSFHSRLLHDLCASDYKQSRHICRYALTAYQMINGDLPQNAGDYISLASIFINIGYLPIYTELDAVERVSQVVLTADLVEEWKHLLRASLGKLILEKWKFDQKFIDVVDLSITESFSSDMKAVVYSYEYVKSTPKEELVPLDKDLSDSFTPLGAGKYYDLFYEYLQGRGLVE